MKEFKYYQVRRICDFQGFIYWKKENAEKLKNKLNKQFGDFFVVEEMILIFKDGK